MVRGQMHRIGPQYAAEDGKDAFEHVVVHLHEERQGLGRLLGRGLGRLVDGLEPESAFDACDLGGELLVLGINAALGGATAGIAQELNGGSFLEGLREGAAGGAVVYAGKRLNTLDVDQAGLVGRMLGAVGASVIRNSAAARPPTAEPAPEEEEPLRLRQKRA